MKIKVNFIFNCEEIEVQNFIKAKNINKLLESYTWDYYTTKQPSVPAANTFTFQEKGVPFDKQPQPKHMSIDIGGKLFKQLVANSEDVY